LFVFGTFVPKNKDEKRPHEGAIVRGKGGSGAPEGSLYDVLGHVEGVSGQNDRYTEGVTIAEEGQQVG
jgi:hypothetical protein